MIFTAEKSLKDAGDKVAEDVKKEVEEKVTELRKILDSGSKEELEEKTRELSDSLQKIGQAMYQKQGQQESTDGQAEEPKKESDGETNGQKKQEEPVEGEVVE